MLEVIQKGNFSNQELMNELATLWTWAKVVYDTETTENVTQLWATDKVYFELKTGTNSTYIQQVHTDGFSVAICGNAGTTSNVDSFFKNCTIVRTENAIMVQGYYNSVPAPGLAVGKISYVDGTESVGIAVRTNSYNAANPDKTWCVYDDHMNGSGSYILDTTTTERLTLLVPFCNHRSDARFTHLYRPMMSNVGSACKLELEGKNYYMLYSLAVEYTE